MPVFFFLAALMICNKAVELLMDGRTIQGDLEISGVLGLVYEVIHISVLFAHWIDSLPGGLLVLYFSCPLSAVVFSWTDLIRFGSLFFPPTEQLGLSDRIQNTLPI